MACAGCQSALACTCTGQSQLLRGISGCVVCNFLMTVIANGRFPPISVWVCGHDTKKAGLVKLSGPAHVLRKICRQLSCTKREPAFCDVKPPFQTTPYRYSPFGHLTCKHCALHEVVLKQIRGTAVDARSDLPQVMIPHMHLHFRRDPSRMFCPLQQPCA